MSIESDIRALVREEVQKALAERDVKPANDETAEYLTTKQVSALVALAVVTLEQMRMRGAGPPFVRAGRRVLYAKVAVDAWLKSAAR